MYTIAKCTHVSGIEMILQKKLNFTLSYKKKNEDIFEALSKIIYDSSRFGRIEFAKHE